MEGDKEQLYRSGSEVGQSSNDAPPRYPGIHPSGTAVQGPPMPNPLQPPPNQVVSINMPVPVLPGLTFLTASIASGTIILDVGQLAGGAFQNLFLIGLFRVFTPLVSVCLDWYVPDFGRRPFFFAANAVVLSCFLVVLASLTFLPGLMGPSSATSLAGFFSLAGAICNMFVWIVIIQLTFELYPTLLRNTALAYTGLADSTGSVLVPQIVYLRRFWAAGPICIAIGLLFVSTSLGWAVYPETKKRTLVELRKVGVDSRPLLLGEEDSEDDQL